jgi:transcriptional regulator GlxA family with amidase domain
MLTIYAEPQRLSGAALLAAANSAGAPKLDSLAAALQAQPREHLPDPRLRRALEQVDALLSGKVSAAAVAQAAHLSRTMRSLFGVRADRSLRQLKVKLLD